ncbi:hypothetical protein EKO27_g9138 [Xylaria grammica]|uniref:Uncharacterized protein n=1 Tax=Xylaria grammica TaxID=363999 RepID=A0A439CUY0_9PEZI|nr:hypothetical protein EKO27_g9138 [Xylaria grammica]
MTSASFTPYWKAVGLPEEPYSWVFFVVAKIAGRHRPLAVVTSIGGSSEEETLRGYPLTAACHRIVTIFADSANHIAIRAELALAATYYVRDDDREQWLDPVELPELDRTQAEFARRRRPWDCATASEFPFIAACLLQGVAFDAQGGDIRPARLEPLGTVYRDTSKEWGMAVVDITDLGGVRYGIVGFSSARMVFVPTETAQRNRCWLGAHNGFALHPGTFRVMDEVRPRRAMSAAEFMAKWDRGHVPVMYSAVNEPRIADLLAHIPLVDPTALDLVWPSDSPAGVLLSRTKLSGEDEDRSVIKLVDKVFDADDFDISAFNSVRALSNFQEILRRTLIKYSARLDGTQSSGKLIQLAFVDENHLGLETLPVVSVEAIAGALSVSKNVTSISICVESLLGAPVQLINTLSERAALRKIFFLQSPTHTDCSISVRLFEELAARPWMLRRVEVMFSGAYSAALRKQPWLPTVPRGTMDDAGDVVQLAPLGVFPVQQMFVRRQNSGSPGDTGFSYCYAHMGDALLKPERFISGFILFLRSLVSAWWQELDMEDMKSRLFSFSSAPSSLADDAATAAEISPILSESFAAPIDTGSNTVKRPRVRDLVPDGWTVMVSEEKPTARSQSSFVRYGFIRPHRPIAVGATPLVPPSLEELEVVGLKEFLGVMAPEVDLAVADRHLRDLANQITTRPYQGTLPPSVEPLSALSREDVTDVLLDFLRNARAVNDASVCQGKECTDDSAR